MTLRCPICLAPLVVPPVRAGGGPSDLIPDGAWVCSRYPYGYHLGWHDDVITEAGWCLPNGLRDTSPGFVCVHAQEGTRGWAVCLNAPYLVPVQDTLVDLIEDSKGAGYGARV